ncbi:MAG: MFS transporter [Candidimonas sp.]|nr:MAG: MFS transporter [Candidimonas sp.]
MVAAKNAVPDDAILTLGESERRHEARKVVFASFIGTTIEWYDFYLYSTCAALIFPRLFFPHMETWLGIIASFATYALGFVARPVGAWLFGVLGDRQGRKKVLIETLLVMGIGTVLIGLLPTYETAGSIAALFLIILRLAQGIGIGGEWGSAVVIAVEHAPKELRGLYGSAPQVGVPAGLLLSTFAFWLTSHSMSDAALFAWGWRIPFLAGIVLVILGIAIRISMMESPVFVDMVKQKTLSKSPTRDMLQTQRRSLWIAIGMRLLQNAVFYLYTSFFLIYVVQYLHLPRSVGLNNIMLYSALGFISLPFWSWLTDKFGRKVVYLTGTVLSTLFVVPYFWLLQTGSMFAITVAVVVGLNFFHDSMYGPQAVYYSELFDAKVRQTGASVAYAVASVLAGGFSPIIAEYLLHKMNGQTWGVSLYVIVVGILSIIAVLCARETKDDILYEKSATEKPATGQRVAAGRLSTN